MKKDIKYKLSNKAHIIKYIRKHVIDDIRKSLESPSPHCKAGYLIATNENKEFDTAGMKERCGGNEKYHRLLLKLLCDKIEPEWIGRPSVLLKISNPQNLKVRYRPSQEKIEVLQKEMIAFICDYLDISETQFYRICRMIEKKMEFNQFIGECNRLFASLQVLP